jgi:hypothetical protein
VFFKILNSLYLYPLKKQALSKFTLDVEYDFDFVLLGISCHEKDYRISWALRDKLHFDLCRGEDLVISSKRPGESGAYAVYEGLNEDNDSSIYLVANRSDSSFLIPEQKACDYFLIARGAYDHDNKGELLLKIREIPFVLTAFSIDPQGLRSRQNLIF